jgi:hypothetical protein
MSWRTPFNQELFWIVSFSECVSVLIACMHKYACRMVSVWELSPNIWSMINIRYDSSWDLINQSGQVQGALKTNRVNFDWLYWILTNWLREPNDTSSTEYRAVARIEWSIWHICRIHREELWGGLWIALCTGGLWSGLHLEGMAGIEMTRHSTYFSLLPMLLRIEYVVPLFMEVGRRLIPELNLDRKWELERKPKQ